MVLAGLLTTMNVWVVHMSKKLVEKADIPFVKNIKHKSTR